MLSFCFNLHTQRREKNEEGGRRGWEQITILCLHYLPILNNILFLFFLFFIYLNLHSSREEEKEKGDGEQIIFFMFSYCSFTLLMWLAKRGRVKMVSPMAKHVGEAKWRGGWLLNLEACIWLPWWRCPNKMIQASLVDGDQESGGMKTYFGCKSCEHKAQ